ncbi:5'-deoxyadenosine deaminase [Artemisia annua]|uniref:5'-deoxyadenosine deaminase n=1 Tax=Artemisia annua TaxID=35608 RepID=A0A2U1KYK2_ARTAN|nr:5'-deoxyadenosine deaminase [Artemisia annua]
MRSFASLARQLTEVADMANVLSHCFVLLLLLLQERRLINTHIQTSQQLARGIADDVDLLTWLHHRIWPYESNMTEEEREIEENIGRFLSI